ncbi:restriction system protein [Sagittula marina]|uniref:Restriction system protein n=2 Tax=Sagittula marina TaxID=943940 RepID=A0A7W6GSU9_9RHOB|nr:restriction system protein [Sagittula marina]
MKAAEKDRVRRAKAAERRDLAERREAARQAKAYEAKVRKAEVTDERDRKAHEKAVKAAHAVAQQSEVERMNSEVDAVFDDLEGLLAATIDVDDHIDLDTLRKPFDATPFDMPDLEIPLVAPKRPKVPSEPTYVEPAKPKGFFGKRRKLEEARAMARQTHETRKAEWASGVLALEEKYAIELAAYEQAEAERVDTLAAEKDRFRRELDDYNQSIDQFITNLSYGDAEAVQEYISLVVENSTYPDHFEVTHEFSFAPETAELRMSVTVPTPDSFPAVKGYKYVKTSDEIREVPLSQTEIKKRYASVLHQVAIRSLHEVFEADRRGLIRTISLEVGTKAQHPATGRLDFLPFVGVSAERDSFMEFDLSGLVPLATLKHLGAAISKDPVALVAVDVKGVRKS